MSEGADPERRPEVARPGREGHQPLVGPDQQPAALMDLPVVGAANQDEVSQIPLLPSRERE